MFEILAGQAATAIRNAQLYNAQLLANKSLEESNKQLIIAKEDAEKSDRLKSEFLAQMSHEIRTPIHILMSYSSLIQDEIHVNENNKDDEIENIDDKKSKCKLYQKLKNINLVSYDTEKNNYAARRFYRERGGPLAKYFSERFEKMGDSQVRFVFCLTRWAALKHRTAELFTGRYLVAHTGLFKAAELIQGQI